MKEGYYEKRDSYIKRLIRPMIKMVDDLVKQFKEIDNGAVYGEPGDTSLGNEASVDSGDASSILARSTTIDDILPLDRDIIDRNS